MSIELRPLGVTCNISCQYCYQNMHRNAGNGYSSYNSEIVKTKLTELSQPFHLFGGEPLLLPISELSDILEWEFLRHGENTILTNGVLITDQHLDLFKKFNVKIGISIDGPDELNDIRWVRNTESTRKATQKSILAIHKLSENNIKLSLQIQVTKCNSSEHRLPKMLDWLREIDLLKIESARLHILEIDDRVVREKYAFSAEENILIFSKYLDFEKTLKNLRFDIFTDMKNMLIANDSNTTCTWRACDPYSTEAVSGMDGEGRLSNCGLTDKEGINFQKPDRLGYERYIALYYTPQEYGGCKDCRFFLSCKGQCPGTAIDSDWRNKSENCGVWKHFFEKIESEVNSTGNIPVSLSPNRKEIELDIISQWAEGMNPTIQSIRSKFEK
jgi:uncharacterized protein